MAQAGQQTGVGLTLAPHPPSGALKVTHMDPDGPAARGGLIQIGDVLFDVDDTSVVGLHGGQVRTLILGAPGKPG
jgi:C-terminal processing protease CtpA/Prc